MRRTGVQARRRTTVLLHADPDDDRGNIFVDKRLICILRSTGKRSLTGRGSTERGHGEPNPDSFTKNPQPVP